MALFSLGGTGPAVMDGQGIGSPLTTMKRQNQYSPLKIMAFFTDKSNLVNFQPQQENVNKKILRGSRQVILEDIF